jgi:serine/threonine protein kinase
MMSDSIYLYEPLWGSWKIDSLIGEGPYGKVYKAFHDELGFHYESAVKHIAIPNGGYALRALFAEGADEASAKAFFAECAQSVIKDIHAMVQLKGLAGFVAIEDYKAIERRDGLGFDILIRMECLKSLSDACRDHKMDAKAVAAMALGIAYALAACEERGLVHRAVKPDNIFCAHGEIYKLGDIGFSGSIHDSFALYPREANALFAAPEAVRGESAGFSADTYSLGLVMYYLLNGKRPPFCRPGQPFSLKERQAALARRLSGENPPPPAEADAMLCDIVLKAISYRPSSRYAARALASDLERYLSSRMSPIKPGDLDTAESIGSMSDDALLREPLRFEDTHPTQPISLSLDEILFEETLSYAEDEAFPIAQMRKGYDGTLSYALNTDASEGKSESNAASAEAPESEPVFPANDSLAFVQKKSRQQANPSRPRFEGISSVKEPTGPFFSAARLDASASFAADPPHSAQQEKKPASLLEAGPKRIETEARLSSAQGIGHIAPGEAEAGVEAPAPLPAKEPLERPAKRIETEARLSNAQSIGHIAPGEAEAGVEAPAPLPAKEPLERPAKRFETEARLSNAQSIGHIAPAEAEAGAEAPAPLPAKEPLERPTVFASRKNRVSLDAGESAAPPQQAREELHAWPPQTPPPADRPMEARDGLAQAETSARPVAALPISGQKAESGADDGLPFAGEAAELNAFQSEAHLGQAPSPPRKKRLSLDSDRSMAAKRETAIKQAPALKGQQPRSTPFPQTGTEPEASVAQRAADTTALAPILDVQEGAFAAHMGEVEDPKLGPWVVTAYFFDDPIQECTGFSLRLTIIASPNGKDLSHKVRHANFSVFVQNTSGKWQKVGKIRSGAVGKPVYKDFSFQKTNLAGFVAVPPNSTIAGTYFYSTGVSGVIAMPKTPAFRESPKQST